MTYLAAGFQTSLLQLSQGAFIPVSSSVVSMRFLNTRNLPNGRRCMKPCLACLLEESSIITLPTYIHTYIRTYIHTYINAYIHVRICVLMCYTHVIFHTYVHVKVAVLQDLQAGARLSTASGSPGHSGSLFKTMHSVLPRGSKKDWGYLSLTVPNRS